MTDELHEWQRIAYQHRAEMSARQPSTRVRTAEEDFAEAVAVVGGGTVLSGVILLVLHWAGVF